MSGILSTCWKQFAVSLIAVISCLCLGAQNPIVTENALPGNPSTEWDVNGAGDASIQGFATDISVNKGGTVHFKIKTDAAAYTINIYRIGYYNGNGARFAGTGTITATLPQSQPTPVTDLTTGLVDCGNWNESAHWNVPSTAVPGVYIARLRRTDNGGASHIIFIVRDDASTADLLFKTSDATWQAYNVYGGNSAYVGNTSFRNGHGVKLSYNRPFITRDGGGGGLPGNDYFFNAEYAMIRWLERNGYHLSYTTDVDMTRDATVITPAKHKILLSVGHDEYWSLAERTKFENARNAGVHLAFFSGNEVYWKIRWENSFDGANTPYRTFVCYKEGSLGENVCYSNCDPSPEWTGLWRDGCDDPGSGGCNPENALTGQMSWTLATGSIQVPAAYKNIRFWRNTSIANLGNGNIATLPYGTLGHEWDWEQYFDSYPSGRITMSSTTLNGLTHKLSLYRHTSGALVFGAGTVQWSWGLDSVHDGSNQPVSKDMQQATVNLFADMGVQPGALQNDLVAATPSTDTQAPAVIINSPLNNDTIPFAGTVTITGTASDANYLAGIEVSVDGGATWKPATGTTNWSFSWTPTALGPAIIKVRGFDDSGNMGVPGSAPSPDAITLIVGPPACPCHVFNHLDIPQRNNVYDSIIGIEPGVRFRSAVSGYIKGIRFYKSTSDTGTHVGNLWSNNGTLLATAVFVNESASGWQEVFFDSAVAITAGTVYTASYHSPTGYYTLTPSYFNTAHTNGPLTAIAYADTAGPNGVFEYATTSVFPTRNFGPDNYWVDVIFDNNAVDIAPPQVTSTSPANGASGVSIYASLNVTFSESIDPATVTDSTIQIKDNLNVTIPATVSYNDGEHKATLTPLSPLSALSSYTAIVKGDSSGIKDLSGNPLEADVVETFTTAGPPPPGMNDGPGGPILVISNMANPFSRYAVEILRAEGLNEFAALDIAAVDSAVLSNYDVVILGEMAVTTSQVTMLTDWVNAGGTLIAFKPDAALSPLLGLSAPTGTLSNKYLLVNTASGPGTGIVNQTIQFHGTANLYTLNGAASLATLYSDAVTATTNPAVTTMEVGANGGKAVAFTYDLARSIVYTRQGNPAWAGQKRDGTPGGIRSDDLFYGNAAFDPQPDWIDFDKVSIPQADEQQRLLANIILQYNLHRKPLPRFWYLPRELKAAVVMTGDDHANSGTAGRFNHYLTLGPNTPQDVANWNAVRGTSYLFPGSSITDAQVAAFQAQGFEIALHPNTFCGSYTESSLTNTITTQFENLTSNLPSLSPLVSNRTHCLTWSDWASQAKAEAQLGIRIDVNYYYWPDTWVANRPGMFTGSGMPMRFADLDGTLIDCYQATTQMTDESGIDISAFCNAVLDKAIGPEGYYGVFTTNMHTDTGANHTGSAAVINSALARQVPVISAKQLLTWLDGRNNSSFGSIAWAGNVLNFTITAASGSTNLRAMLPVNAGSATLSQITREGNPISFTTSIIKGIEYAFFDGSVTGNYTAVYGPVTSISGTVTLQGRPAAPNSQWIVPVQVELYLTGNPTPVTTFNTTTNMSGQFTVTGVPVGTYNIRVKSSHTLARVLTDQTLVAGNNAIDFGTLLEGDVNNDNFVTLADLSSLINSFNKTVGDPGYDARADLNNDNFVTLADLSLLISNFNQAGENNP